MLGLLVKKSDRLFVQLKYYLLDEYCFFKPEFAHLNGMFLGNASESRIFPEACQSDRDEKTDLIEENFLVDSAQLEAQLGGEITT